MEQNLGLSKRAVATTRLLELAKSEARGALPALMEAQISLKAAKLKIDRSHKIIDGEDYYLSQFSSASDDIEYAIDSLTEAINSINEGLQLKTH